MTRRSSPADDLNLIPVMNLVTLLIPFLLMSAQFVTYAVIDTTLPAICGTPCSAGTTDEEPITVSLDITDGGWLLRATGRGLDAFGEGVSVPCATPRCEGPPEEAWDTAGLRHHLLDIKQTHPGHRHLVLSATDRAPYEALILTMDAAREDPSLGGMPGEDCVGRCLFPDVTLAGGLAGDGQ